MSFEELLIPQVVHQETLTRLLLENGFFTKEEFLETVKVVDREMRRRGSKWGGQACNIANEMIVPNAAKA